MFSGKVILIAPLDWGLGHATRCVPLIRKLTQNNKVIIGVTPLTSKIFEEEFPELEKVEVPAYNIRYSLWTPVWARLLWLWPSINITIQKEKSLVENLIIKKNINVVISDNRFGFYSPAAYSVFITHQLFLKTPFANTWAQKINREHILHYNEVWVPDYENETISLSGQLSHGQHFHSNVRYIGPLSRLEKQDTIPAGYDVLFLLSGPEPQHSNLAKKFLTLSKKRPGFRFVMAGNTVASVANISNMNIVIAPTSQQLSGLITQSQTVVCRSGYSSLMDLHLLEKKDIILVPTPGQTEQEYLATYWQKKFGVRLCTEAHLEKLFR